MYAVNLEGLIAIFMSLSIPIVAVIMIFSARIHKYKAESKVRQALIEHGNDAETMRILLAEQTKSTNKYITLRWAGALLGMGLGGVLGYTLSGDKNVLILSVVTGIGVGLLLAFIAEYILTKNDAKRQADDTTCNPC